MDIRRLLWPIVLIYLFLLSNSSADSVYYPGFTKKYIGEGCRDLWLSETTLSLLWMADSRKLLNLTWDCYRDGEYKDDREFCTCVELGLRMLWSTSGRRSNTQFGDIESSSDSDDSDETIYNGDYGEYIDDHIASAACDLGLIFEYPVNKRMITPNLTYPSCRADINYAMICPYKARACRVHLGRPVENHEKGCPNCSGYMWVYDILGGMRRYVSPTGVALKYGRKSLSGAEHGNTCVVKSEPKEGTKKRQKVVLQIPDPKSLKERFLAAKSRTPKNCVPPASFWEWFWGKDEGSADYVPCTTGKSTQQTMALLREIFKNQNPH